jgi:hypothetical protein
MFKLNNWNFSLITAGMFIIFAQTCDQGTHPEDVNYVLPEQNLSYYENIQPLLAGKCGSDSHCHSGDNTGLIDNGLYFNSKENLLDYRFINDPAKPLIDIQNDPLDPGQAPLYLLLLEGITVKGHPIERMPPATFGKKKLNENNLNGIRQWIKEGCPD